jgi:subfamily B ATP-binding cassette protein MsbA
VRDALTEGVTVLVRDTLTTAALFALALSLDSQLALVAMVAVPLAAVQASFFARRLRSAYRRADHLRGELAGRAQETLANIEAVKVDAFEGDELDRFARDSRSLADIQIVARATRATSSAVMELVGVGGLGLTLAYAIWRINAGELEPAAFLSFFAALMLLYEPLRGLGRVNAYLQAGASAIERLEGLKSLPAEPSGTALVAQLDRIELRDTSLTYPDGTVVIDRLSATLEAGTTTTVVGSSGAGKSSLVRMLLGLVPPTAGEVLVNGVPMAELDIKAFRRIVGYAGQEVLLFDTSVAANLRLARPESSDDELVEACRAAAAHEFITDLPEGYDTRIGERGHRLSGGQRQRLALARALLKAPAMLVLDEALTGLDLPTRRAVMDAVRAIRRDTILVLISHSDEEEPTGDDPSTTLRVDL